MDNRIDLRQVDDKDHLIDYMKELIAMYYKVDKANYMSRSRKAQVVKIKYIAMYFIYETFLLSLHDVGAIFKMDHATVLHAIKKIKGFYTYDKQVQKEIDEIKSLFNHGKLILEGRFDANDNHYYIDLNSFLSIKDNAGKAIIFSGFSLKDVQYLKLIDTRNGSEIFTEPRNIVKHENKKLYILEKNKNPNKDEKDNHSN